MGINTKLSKKWHSIPIGIKIIPIVLVLIISGFFITFKCMDSDKSKALTFQYNLCGYYDEDSSWHSGAMSEWCQLRNDNTLVIEGEAGETFSMEVWVFNTATNFLKVLTEVTDSTGYVTISGYPMGNVPNSYKGEADPEWKGIITTKISEDAPIGEIYTVTFSFGVESKGNK